MTQTSGATSNALVNVIHSTGIGAGPCFFPFPRKKPGCAWTNQNVRQVDTMATCEIKNIGGELFSVSSPVALSLTVEPVTVGQRFPTLCVVSLATASQRLDSIAAREVVLKEWRLISTEDRRTGASRLLIPLRTIFNVASVVSSEPPTNLTRLFLSLRFLGDVDRSNCHEIASVRLSYIREGSVVMVGGGDGATVGSDANNASAQNSADASVEVVCFHGDKEGERSPSFSPPPPRRARTMPRTSEALAGDEELFDSDLSDSERDSKDVRLAPGTVIEVSEGEDNATQREEDRREDVPPQGQTAPVPVPTSPPYAKSITSTTARPDSGATPSLTVRQWVTHITDDSDGFVAGGGHSHAERTFQQRPNGPAPLSNTSRVAQSQDRQGQDEDVLAKATALLGLSRQSLWEKASSRAKSRNSSRAHSTTSSRAGGHADQDGVTLYANGNEVRSRCSASTQTDRSDYSIDEGTQVDLTVPAQVSRLSVSGSEPPPPPPPQQQSRWRPDSVGEAAPTRQVRRPHLSSPQRDMPGEVRAKRTFARYTDPKQLPRGRLWRTESEPVPLSRPARSDGVNRVHTNPPPAFSTSSSRFVPTFKLRNSFSSSERINHVNDGGGGSDIISAEWHRRGDNDREASRPLKQTLNDITNGSHHVKHLDDLKERDTGRSLVPHSSPAARVPEKPMPLSVPAAHHRTLFPSRSPLLFEETPMGPRDAVSPSWSFTPVAERLQTRIRAREALQEDQKRIMASASGSPHTPAGQAVPKGGAAGGVTDTYWILTGSRPSDRHGSAEPAMHDGEDQLATTPAPPQLPPPPRSLSARGLLFSGAHSSEVTMERGRLFKSRKTGNKSKSKSGSAPSRDGSADTAMPPPLPLQESPAGRQPPSRNAATVLGGAMCGSFFVRKHHASRSGTGRRVLSIQRGVTDAAQSSRLDTVISLQKLGSGSHAVAQPWRTVSSAARTAENGTGECHVSIGSEDSVEVLTGPLAFTSGYIHQSKVRKPECCLVLQCNGLLVAAVEMEKESDARMAKAILSASLA